MWNKIYKTAHTQFIAELSIKCKHITTQLGRQGRSYIEARGGTCFLILKR